MIKDLDILNSQNELQTISLIGVQGDCEYTFPPSCGKLFYDMVICFFTFGKLFLYYTFLNQNALHISEQIGQIFVFVNSKVSNLKSLSKICSRNNSFSAFVGMVS